MSHRTRTILAAALLAPSLLWGGIAVAAAPATPLVAAADGAVEGEITWGIEPSDSEGNPTGEVSYRLSVDPGDTFEGHALVTNYSEVPVTFGILAADGIVSADGNFDILRADEESVDVGTWIQVQDSVEVGAGESVVVPWTLTVPENATPGDHPGGITASVTQAATGEGPQVSFDTRVGVRIHLRVKGDIVPSVSFSDITTRYDASINPFAPGDLYVEYTMTNDGNVRLGSIQQWDVFGLFRLPAGGTGPSGTVIGQQREILPGQSARVSTVIEDVWPLGRLTTELSAFNESVGADQVGRDLPTVREKDVAWAVPWSQLVVLVLLLGAWWALRERRRRRAAAHARAIEEARAQGAREAAAAAGGLDGAVEGDEDAVAPTAVVPTVVSPAETAPERRSVRTGAEPGPDERAGEA